MSKLGKIMQNACPLSQLFTSLMGPLGPKKGSEKGELGIPVDEPGLVAVAQLV